jgi:hypothetical protein
LPSDVQLNTGAIVESSIPFVSNAGVVMDSNDVLPSDAGVSYCESNISIVSNARVVMDSNKALSSNVGVKIVTSNFGLMEVVSFSMSKHSSKGQ